MSLVIKEKTLEIASFMKLAFRTFIAYFIAVLIFIPLLICKQKNNKTKFKIWFIYVSNYQKDILFNLLKQKYNIDLYKKFREEINLGSIYQVSLNEGKFSKEISNEYNLLTIKNIFKKLITSNLKLPKKVYLSSISPLLFPNPFIHGIFLVYKYLKLVKYIDDGLSGNIYQNRLQNLKFCPEPKYIYSWNFKNYFNLGSKVNNKKLDFNILLKLISEKEEINHTFISEIKNVVVSSKYLDYDLTIKSICSEKDYEKNIIYIPHPRSWKNSSYFLKNFNLVKTKFIESWIFKNSCHIDNIYIGVSATTLVIAELKLLEKLKLNIHLFLNEKNSPINSRKELFSFIDSALVSKAYKSISLNGKRID